MLKNKLKKETKNYLIFILLFALGLYLVTSFVTLNLDITEWHIQIRAGIAIFWVIISGFMSVVLFNRF